MLLVRVASGHPVQAVGLNRTGLFSFNLICPFLATFSPQFHLIGTPDSGLPTAWWQKLTETQVVHY